MDFKFIKNLKFKNLYSKLLKCYFALYAENLFHGNISPENFFITNEEN